MYYLIKLKTTPIEYYNGCTRPDQSESYSFSDTHKLTTDITEAQTFTDEDITEQGIAIAAAGLTQMRIQDMYTGKHYNNEYFEEYESYINNLFTGCVDPFTAWVMDSYYSICL